MGVGGSERADSPSVLLVDDDENILDFLGLALEDEGYTVTTAHNGAEALTLVRQQRPSVIVLDLWMPVMDGWQFLREYRSGPGPHAAVIALTAAQYDPARNAEIEADGFLTKPFSIDSLLDIVNLFSGKGPTLE